MPPQMLKPSRAQGQSPRASSPPATPPVARETRVHRQAVTPQPRLTPVGGEAAIGKPTPVSTTDWVARDGLTAKPGTRRILLTISYDGTRYAGWQRQLNGLAVQQCVEDALFTLTGERITITGASRTDAGVHALGQCAHFDTASRIPADRFPYALNTCLPRDIRVLAGAQAAEGFHARFDAKGKQYAYRIHNAPHASALYRDMTVHVPVALNVAAMRQALPQLLGTHNFAAFQASGGTAKTTVRALYAATLTQSADACAAAGFKQSATSAMQPDDCGELTLTVYGNAFLYNMVRIIAGTLIEIGKGKLPVSCFTQALATGNRLLLGPTAPACGLTLQRVFYAADAL